MVAGRIHYTCTFLTNALSQIEGKQVKNVPRRFSAPGCCIYCGSQGDPELHLEHIIPDSIQALPADVNVLIVADRGFGDQKLYQVLTEELKC